MNLEKPKFSVGGAVCDHWIELTSQHAYKFSPYTALWKKPSRL